MTPTDFEQPPSYLVLGATGDIGAALRCPAHRVDGGLANLRSKATA